MWMTTAKLRLSIGTERRTLGGLASWPASRKKKRWREGRGLDNVFKQIIEALQLLAVVRDPGVVEFLQWSDPPGPS